MHQSPAFFFQVYSGLRGRLLLICLRCYSQKPAVKRCYYAVLGVSSAASPDAIRSAYYTKCKTTHPDVTSANPKDFLEINEAYSVLTNPELRHAYDSNRKTAQKQDDEPPPPFSCSPCGPSITFSRASEIFHARKFRRHLTEASWPDCEPALGKGVPRRQRGTNSYEEYFHYTNGIKIGSTP
ncbi:Chaperone protein DnaJ [Taenia crassiceps]|uniref:Chaperone protein DnaJ n=1 Tax=Taenia crassiceps TaxID=6207 RepID=A0ABR4QHX5_9CEST